MGTERNKTDIKDIFIKLEYLNHESTAIECRLAAIENNNTWIKYFLALNFTTTAAILLKLIIN